MSERERKAAEARRLRAQGLTAAQIGERMGCSRSTVSSWFDDPTGAKLAARKDRYRGRCEECGKPTDGSRGVGKAPTRCVDCIRWTDDEIVAAMRAWAAKHGRAPRVDDWRLATRDHPSSSIGPWNALLLKAGLPLACDRREATQEEIEQLLRDGLTPREVSARVGLSAATIRQRMQYRGTTAGALNGHTVRKLSPEEKRAIAERRAAGARAADLAVEFGVHKQTIWCVARRVRAAA